MAARATRSASRKARRTEAVATGPLGALSHDELGVIVDGLVDPLLAQPPRLHRFSRLIYRPFLERPLESDTTDSRSQ